MEELKRTQEIQWDSRVYSSIAATCAGVTSPQVVEKILQSLKKASIEVADVWMSAMSVIVLVAATDREKALHSL
jgi:aspartokinase